MYGYVSGKIVPGSAYKLPHYTTFEVDVRPAKSTAQLPAVDSEPTSE